MCQSLSVLFVDLCVVACVCVVNKNTNYLLSIKLINNTLQNNQIRKNIVLEGHEGMSLRLEELNETQQLMQNEGDEEEQKVPQPTTSPVHSNKTSSEAASLTSKTVGQTHDTANSSINDSTKLSYVNEKRLHRDLMRSNYNNKPKLPKETTDVKHMEKALLELLDDFHSGKLSAFSSGCTMEQMINIQDQQEHLARLHFKLYGEVDNISDEGFDTTASRDKMSQLVQSLEQLSASIEHLHSKGESAPEHTADQQADE